MRFIAMRLAFLACFIALPEMAAATCTLGSVAAVPLTISGSRLYVPVSLNETEGRFLVDTGASLTVLAANYAARSHVGIDVHAGQKIFSGAGGRETLPVNQAHVRRIEVGKLAFQDWEFAVLPEAAGETGRDGVLGMDFLHYFDLDFDLVGRTLTLWRLSGCSDIHPEWQGDYDAIPLVHTANQGVTMPIFIDNAFLNVEFDTGADGVLLTRAAGARAGVSDEWLAKATDTRRTGIGGHFPSTTYQFQLMLVGKGEFDHPAVDVETESHRTSYADGLIDWRYLKARKFWVSYATNTLFVQPAGK
jgi:predicted aspartyl protease